MERLLGNYFQKLILPKEGSALVENDIVASFIAAVISGSVSLLGLAILGLFSSVPSF